MTLDYRAIPFAGAPLDRAAESRKDDAWLTLQAAREDKRLVPVWRDLNFMGHSPGDTLSPFAMTLAGTRVAALQEYGDLPWIFLGLEAQTPFFAVDLSSWSEDEAAALHPDAEFMDLRRRGPFLQQRDAALMAYARAITHWHRSHQYCGRCGSPTTSMHGGHARVCSNPDCARESYPRTDPAVIMLVEYLADDGSAPLCLLGRQAVWPPGVYSTLAGFVDPGENLEEAVIREVREEAGIEVTDVRYLGSQPWPFPASIMLGFTARALSRELSIGEDELHDARWFSARELATFGDWNDDSASLRLPRRDSIARLLVEYWLAAHS